MKIILLLSFFISLNSFAASPSDIYKYTYLDHLIVNLKARLDENANLSQPQVLEELFFKKADSKTVAVEIVYPHGAKFSPEDKKKVIDYFKGEIESYASSLNIQGVKTKFSVRNELPDE